MQSYSKIFTFTANNIDVLMSRFLKTQPRSALLRLFFCWVCYSVAISTVFRSYLNLFRIEPGNEETTKNVEQMLSLDMMLGFLQTQRIFF